MSSMEQTEKRRALKAQHTKKRNPEGRNPTGNQVIREKQTVGEKDIREKDFRRREGSPGRTGHLAWCVRKRLKGPKGQKRSMNLKRKG